MPDPLPLTEVARHDPPPPPEPNGVFFLHWFIREGWSGWTGIYSESDERLKVMKEKFGKSPHRIFALPTPPTAKPTPSIAFAEMILGIVRDHIGDVEVTASLANAIIAALPPCPHSPDPGKIVPDAIREAERLVIELTEEIRDYQWSAGRCTQLADAVDALRDARGKKGIPNDKT